VNFKTDQQELAYQSRKTHDNINFINILTTSLKTYRVRIKSGLKMSLLTALNWCCQLYVQHFQ